LTDPSVCQMDRQSDRQMDRIAVAKMCWKQ